MKNYSRGHKRLNNNSRGHQGGKNNSRRSPGNKRGNQRGKSSGDTGGAMLWLAVALVGVPVLVVAVIFGYVVVNS